VVDSLLLLHMDRPNPNSLNSFSVIALKAVRISSGVLNSIEIGREGITAT
jgi:hypothetical protein